MNLNRLLPAAIVALLSTPLLAQFDPMPGSRPNAGFVHPDQITASLAGNIALNNTSNYFDGPTIAQGSLGTWFVSGTVTVNDSVQAIIFGKLWDGTSVIASGVTLVVGGDYTLMTLSGFIVNPKGNLRLSVKDATNTSGFMVANTSSNGKDGTITAFRLR